MEINGAIKVERPDQTSHFRLVDCPDCQAIDNVAYILGDDLTWKVRCFNCGLEIDIRTDCKHDAQVAWNKMCWDRRDKPCMGCPDRYPGCADHCKKPHFLARQELARKEREAKERDRDLTHYQIKEIRKNRRVRK